MDAKPLCEDSHYLNFDRAIIFNMLSYINCTILNLNSILFSIQLKTTNVF